jgi:AcrR family transcriptional regulator
VLRDDTLKDVKSREGVPLHPTAQNLVDTVKEMLINTPYNTIKSENVLLRSGISRGPLYHHFENFDALIEVAQTQIYQDYVSNLITELTITALALEDPLATREEFSKILQESEIGNTLAVRRLRVGLLHNAASNESFGGRLAVTQESLNLQWMRVYEIAVAKGWADPEIDGRAVAIMVQAVFFGRILDDLSPIHMNSKAWIATLTRLLDSFFFCTALAKRMNY